MLRYIFAAGDVISRRADVACSSQPERRSPPESRAAAGSARATRNCQCAFGDKKCRATMRRRATAVREKEWLVLVVISYFAPASGADAPVRNNGRPALVGARARRCSPLACDGGAAGEPRRDVNGETAANANNCAVTTPHTGRHASALLLRSSRPRRRGAPSTAPRRRTRRRRDAAATR